MSVRENNVQQLLTDVGQQVLQWAKKYGAQEADVMASRSTDFEVKVADGEIITLTQATSKGLGLRVFVDQRMGFCTTSDFSRDSLEQAVQRAVLLAQQAAVDPNNGLVTLPEYVDDLALDVFDPAVSALDAETKIKWAHELEQAARATDNRVRKFRDSGVSNGVSDTVLLTSRGDVRTRQSSNIAIWCTPVAEADGQLQTDSWYDTRTHVADLQDVQSVGRIAAERAARMLGAKPVKTQTAPIIFEPPMAAGLFSGFLGAINGDLVYKKASFVADKLNTMIASPLLTLVDDPRLVRGAASSPFDGEGMPTRRQRLIDQGKLAMFLYDGYIARKAKVKATGNARRSYAGLPHPGAFNVYVPAGEASLQDILSSVPKALLVTRGLGSGLNTVSGEYSRGVNGLWIENGEVVHPVQEVTIAGDYLTMLKDIDAVGQDLQMRGTVGAPTVRISGMTISGA